MFQGTSYFNTRPPTRIRSRSRSRKIERHSFRTYRCVSDRVNQNTAHRQQSCCCPFVFGYSTKVVTRELDKSSVERAWHSRQIKHRRCSLRTACAAEVQQERHYASRYCSSLRRLRSAACENANQLRSTDLPQRDLHPGTTAVVIQITVEGKNYIYLSQSEGAPIVSY